MRNGRKRTAKETAASPHNQQGTSDEYGTERSEGNGGGIGQGIGQLRNGLSWPVEWFGTFPIRKVTSENVAKRLDALLEFEEENTADGASGGRTARHGRRAFLRISETGIEVAGETEDGTEKAPPPLLSHSLRKVCCAVCRVRTAQLAYITREQHSHHGHHVPGRKLCHVFRVSTPLNAQHIQTALADAFRQQKQWDEAAGEADEMANCHMDNGENDDGTTTMLMAWHPPDNAMAMCRGKANFGSNGGTAAAGEHLLNTPTKRGTPSPFSSPFSAQMRFSSSSLFQRIFGGGSLTPKKQFADAGTSCSPAKKMMTPSTIGFRFRKPRWPLSNLRSSAVSATALTKRSSDQIPQNFRWHLSSPIRTLEKSAENEKKQNDEISPPNATKNEEEQLLYDDRIKEWIYPMDVGPMIEELEKLAYFCRPQEKETVMKHLREMPAGHFALRLSGTRRRFLALSIRVERDEKNPKGIAHYLVLRNEHGFRIKGSKRYFQSLPMLITHHSVITDQLPCRLLLSDWRWLRGNANQRRRQSSGGSTLAVLRATEENKARNPSGGGQRQNAADGTTIRWRRDALSSMAQRQNGGHRRTNSSTLISSQSSTFLSA
ncbi:hypothetical protein niasHS_010095 [Heterodera schachtii]|uniref:SH2 domain-containing protein n=1 Tax=Heterodera schachtii TaxID=97005 RepID=A0ABD2J0C1_HETSC